MTQTPTPSASVLIVRPGETGTEIFTVLRSRNLEFASGALAYPGGAIEEDDRRLSAKIDPSDDVLACRIAAIRETFEETGILFAESDGKPLDRSLLDELEETRIPLARGERKFSDIVDRYRLKLTCDKLVFMSLLTTPSYSKRRFSTHFFAATVPENQSGLHDGAELVDSFWCSARKIVEYAQTEEYLVMPPTWINADHFVRHASIGEAFDALAGREVVEAERTVSEVDGDTIRITLKVGGVLYKFSRKNPRKS